MAEQSSSAGGEASDFAAAATDKVREAAGQARDQAGRIVDQIREHAEEFANDKKAAAADQISGLASALRKTAEELDSSDFGFGGYVGRAASSLDGLSDTIRERDFGSLVGEVEAVAKQYPAMFLGATVVAGFVLARFLKTSGEALRPTGASTGGSVQRRSAPRPSPSSQTRAQTARSQA